MAASGGAGEALPAQTAEAPVNASRELDASLEDAELVASAAVGSACDHGIVASIGKKAPGCLQACPQTCGPLQQAIKAFMSGGKKAVTKVVCAHTGAFSCPFDHGSCAPLLAQARGAGAPGSKGSLHSQCH